MNHIRNMLLSSVAILAMADEGGAGAGTETENPAPANAFAPLTDADKIEKLSKAIPSVKFYTTIDDALKAVASASAETENFFGLPVMVVGYDDSKPEEEALAELGPVYDGMTVRVGTLAERVEVNGKSKNAVKAITVLPIPTVDALLASEEGKALLTKIVGKELAHVAYRNLRGAATAEELTAGLAKSPKTVEEYLAESKRAGSASDTETFDVLWTPLRASIKDQFPAVAKLLPSKVEVIKAIRSKEYAMNEYPELESMKGGSMFIKLAQAVIASAAVNKNKDQTPNPLDSTAVAEWLAERDTTKLTKRGPEEKDFSVLASIDFNL